MKFICSGNIFEIFFFILDYTDSFLYCYRFPLERYRKQQLVDSINKNNDDDHESKGLGWLCNLHFLSTDIEKVKGRLKLTTDAVPVLFDAPNIASQALENIADDETSNSCNNCVECIDLNLKLKDLERMMLEFQMEYAVSNKRRTNWKTEEQMSGSIVKKQCSQREKCFAVDESRITNR